MRLLGAHHKPPGIGIRRSSIRQFLNHHQTVYLMGRAVMRLKDFLARGISAHFRHF